MTSPLRPSLVGLAASRRFRPVLRQLRSPFAIQTFTREQMKMRREAESQAAMVARPQPGPVASIAVANFLARQKEEAKEEEEEEEEEDQSLNRLRFLEAEVESSEAEMAQIELANTAITSMTCHGCGVHLQTDEPASPGFVEPTLAVEALSEDASPSGLVCRRCLLLKFSSPARSRIAPVDSAELEKVFASIRQRSRATILVVVDLLDIEGSCIPDIFSRLGPHRYLLLGNKVDQLLPDGPGYLQRWENHLREHALPCTGIPPSNLVAALLVSAQTGYNIERLVTQLLAVKLRRQPTYIVGCTNVGKSSLFNRLLTSDLSKVTALRESPEATVSSWPGTTASVLHFPVTTMTHAKQKLRNQRLACDSMLVTREKRDVQSLDFLRPLAGYVGRSFSEPVVLSDEHQGFTTLPTYRYTDGALSESLKTKEIVEERFLKSMKQSDWRFSTQKTCFDTPGYISEQQLSNFLTPKENNVVQGGGRRRLLPRTFSFRPGLVLLLGGIARLEYREGPGGLLLTTQTHLPVHIVEAQLLDAYVAEFGAALAVPDVTVGPVDRPANLPAMAGHEFSLTLSASRPPVSQVDVVFSGAGWVAVTAPFERQKKPDWRQKVLAVPEEEGKEEKIFEINLKASFPEGLPCTVRRPSLLPRAVLQRGPRLRFLQEFQQPPYMSKLRRIAK